MQPSDSLQHIFKLKCLVQNIDVVLSTYMQIGNKHLLALVTRNDIILHFVCNGCSESVKRIPWFADAERSIRALCFDPSATWLLVVLHNGSLCIIPALHLVDKRQRIDCKWSLSDLTYFPKHDFLNVVPTAVVWWQTLDSNQNALVGYENGRIDVISLTDGRCLGDCHMATGVAKLQLFRYNAFKEVLLLISGENGKQWRLMLEGRRGIAWPPDSRNHLEESTKSRLHSLKQLGVDKLAFLRQRLADGRTGDAATEPEDCPTEQLPDLSDTHFSPQYLNNTHLFSAFCKTTGLLTVHYNQCNTDIDSAPLNVYKLPTDLTSLIITDYLIYAINEKLDTLKVISTNDSLRQEKNEKDLESHHCIAQFRLQNPNERIIDLFKVGNVRSDWKDRRNKNGSLLVSKRTGDLKVDDCEIDTCILVTNFAAYRLSCGCIRNKILELLTDYNDLESAERLCRLFRFDHAFLLETAADILIANGRYHSGIILYKQAKIPLPTRVLKFATFADCQALIKYARLCLGGAGHSFRLSRRIHVGNLVIMAYTETILRFSGSARVRNTTDFMHFLSSREIYDEILAVNVACQARLWNVLTHLARNRGLQVEVVAAIYQTLQTTRTPSPNDADFALALSEPSLTRAYFIHPAYSQTILGYVKTNVNDFSLNVLRRFLAQLDPSQTIVAPSIRRSFQNRRHYSSLDSTFDSVVESDGPDGSVAVVKELTDTYLCVLVVYLKKTCTRRYDLDLLYGIVLPNGTTVQQQHIRRFPELRNISCGYEHAAVIRNDCVYTMGSTKCGCLGTGPLLASSRPPKMVQSLADLKVKALSVSCGGRHTLLLTDFGVFCWGSNSHGQLGVGPQVSSTCHPQMIVSLSSVRIVDVVAGQYHSMALSATGHVYTWGWGIHGQLGCATYDNQYYPRRLFFPQPVCRIAAGHAHSLILTCDGKLFGFGSNAFGQLESARVGCKTAKPSRLMIGGKESVIVVRIATAYFQSVAVCEDEKIYCWGASPQEIRTSRSKHNLEDVTTEPWKKSICVHSGIKDKESIEDVAVGYRQLAFVQSKKVLYRKNNGAAFKNPPFDVSQSDARVMQVSCGFEYSMAMEQGGKLWAWGNSALIEMLQDYLAEADSKNERQVVIFRNTGRVAHIPNTPTDIYSISVPDLPSLAITYSSTDPRLSSVTSPTPLSILQMENNCEQSEDRKRTRNTSLLDSLYTVPPFQWGPRTLHYVLETYYNIYDAEYVLAKCLEVEDYQAASKIASLDGHYGDSLAFQLVAFEKYLRGLRLDFAENMPTDTNDTPCVLSSSSSLDSIRHWGDDVEHQGGEESPCRLMDAEDVRQNVNEYVKLYKNGDSPLHSVSEMIETRMIRHDDNATIGDGRTETNVQNEESRNILKTACHLVEFYTQKIYASENHILMQNVLMKCIEFWLANSLPVAVLESVLLRNMDRYFYPLSILLFCKHFNNNNNNNVEGETVKTEMEQPEGFLKQFSTKFCLQLCSMVLQNVNKT